MRIKSISIRQRKKEAALLRQKMEEFELSTDELAKEMNVDQSTVSKWRMGYSPISPTRLMWLGGRFDFNPIALRPDLAVFTSQAATLLKSDADYFDLHSKLDQFLLSAQDSDLDRLNEIFGFSENVANNRQYKG